MAWYNAFSPKALAKQKQDQDHQMKQTQMQLDSQAKMNGDPNADATPPEEDIYGEGALHMNGQMADAGPVQKSKAISVEIYKIEK
jgi:hypothetical protein